MKAKNKLRFIEETLKQLKQAIDQDFSEVDVWDMANSILCLWLPNIIDPKLCMSIAYAKTVHGMWEDLKKRYLVSSAPKYTSLRRELEITNFKQGTLDIVEFYNKLGKLWKELNNHIHVTFYTCEGCKCGAIRR